ncbi:MAG: DUF1290 domain-containing protein [Christensenellales bacterium]|jgi:small basic protein
MLYVLAGIALGLLLGLVLPFSVPAEWSPYVSVALLAALGAALEAAADRQRGAFRAGRLLAAFFGDGLLAAGLAFIGDRLDVPLYLAAVVWFGGRIFAGIGRLRDNWSDDQYKKGQKADNERENQRI